MPKLLIFLGISLIASGLVYWQLRPANQPVVAAVSFAPVVNLKNAVLPTAEPALLAPEIKLLFVGDLMLDRYVATLIQKKELSNLFDPLLATETDFFNNYDLISANLEGAVTQAGQHYAPALANDFAFGSEVIEELKNYNFTFFNLANNHLTDQAQAGVEETRQNLADLNFGFSGCPDGQIGDCTYTVVEINQQKIALLGLSQVYQNIDQPKATKIISDLSSGTDLQIVNLHWGNEYQHQFNQKQQQLAHELIDAGADIIIGHHPHVVQGLEVYQGKPIFYSLGNFIFDQYFSADTQEELTVALTIKPETNELMLNLKPLKSKVSQLSLMSAEEKNVWLDKFLNWSKLEPEYSEQLKQGKIALPLRSN